MYTIKWVAEQLGVTAATLRAWEQRYGVVHPVRSEGGYRLYDDDDLAALRTMARLVADGLQASQAADQARAQTAPRSAEPVGRDVFGDPPAAPGSGLPDPRALVRISRSYDLRALEQILDEAFAAARFEYVVDCWLLAAMTELGRAWDSGELDVSQEHFVSAAVMRRLAAAFSAAGEPRAGRNVVIGLTPGATHEIAALAFATMLRRAGLRVTYLGADLPVPSWLEAVRIVRPDAVVIAAPRAADRAGADEVIRALADLAPDTPVYVGGQGAEPGSLLECPTLSDASERLIDSLS